jgi:hypothetical protein
MKVLWQKLSESQTGYAPLVLRVAAGIIFMAHGA